MSDGDSGFSYPEPDETYFPSGPTFDDLVTQVHAHRQKVLELEDRIEELEGDENATDGGKEATVVTLTDEQIESLANRELAIVKTNDDVFGLIHEDRADEALDAVSTLAADRGAEFGVKGVTERV